MIFWFYNLMVSFGWYTFFHMVLLSKWQRYIGNRVDDSLAAIKFQFQINFIHIGPPYVLQESVLLTITPSEAQSNKIGGLTYWGKIYNRTILSQTISSILTLIMLTCVHSPHSPHIDRRESLWIDVDLRPLVYVRPIYGRTPLQNRNEK